MALVHKGMTVDHTVHVLIFSDSLVHSLSFSLYN